MSSASVAFGFRSRSSRTNCTPRKPVAPVTRMSSSLFSSKPSLVRAQKRKPRDHDCWVPMRRPALRLSILRAVSNYFLLMKQENNFTRSTVMAVRWRRLLSAKVSGSRAVPVGNPGSQAIEIGYSGTHQVRTAVRAGSGLKPDPNHLTLRQRPGRTHSCARSCTDGKVRRDIVGHLATKIENWK